MSVLVACGNSAATRLPDDASIDVRADPGEQAAAFDRECAAGNIESCRNLGMAYASGRGVSPDPRRAFGLFQQACTSRDLAACDDLAAAYLSGTGVDRDDRKAADT